MVFEIFVKTFNYLFLLFEIELYTMILISNNSYLCTRVYTYIFIFIYIIKINYKKL
jgi:hypothetical protein